MNVAGNSRLFGSKGANMHFLRENSMIPVPNFGVLPSSMFCSMVERNSGLRNQIRDLQALMQENIDNWDKIAPLTEEIRRTIHEIGFDEEEKQFIEKMYQEISKSGTLPVSVRSSANKEDLPGQSFAGLYDSYLNQQGITDVICAVLKCYASLFNNRAIQYYIGNKISIIDSSMCVIIQEMISGKTSGTAFSTDISSGAPFVQISASYGCEGVVSGYSDSDSYIISPNGFNVIKITIAEKRSQFVSRVGESGVESHEVSKEKRTEPCLTMEQMKIIAENIKKLQEAYEPIYNGDIDTEFVVDHQENIFMLQIRPLYSSGKKSILDIDQSFDIIKLPIIARGIHSVLGVATGNIKIIESFQDLVSRKIRIEKDDIVVTNRSENEWTQFFVEFKGIVATDGSPTSHPMLIAREKGVPSLVGVPRAVDSLRMYNGCKATIDGIRQCLYLGHAPLVEKPISTISRLFEVVQPMKIRSEEDMLAELISKGRIIIEDGEKWMRPILFKLDPILREMHINAIHRDTETINKCGLMPSIKFERKTKIIDGYIYSNWIHPDELNRLMSPMTLENSLRFFDQKHRCLMHYLVACKSFECTIESLDLLKDAMEELQSYMDLSYPVRTYTAYMTYIIANIADIPLFYLEEYWNKVQSNTVDEDENMKIAAANLSSRITKYSTIDEVREKDSVVFQDIIDFSKDFKLASSENWHEDLLVDKAFSIIKDYEGYKPHGIDSESSARTIYFPEIKELEDWARLTIVHKSIQNTSHHVHVRGLWYIRDKLIQFGEKLVAEGKLSKPTDILKIELEQLRKFIKN